MMAIQTKFLGPTNFRGARVKAFTEYKGHAVTVSYDYGLGVEGEHDRAFLALASKREWFGIWVRGGSPDKAGYTYTCLASEHEGPNSHAKCENLWSLISNDGLALYVRNPKHEATR